jgi:hypothetical protein
MPIVEPNGDFATRVVAHQLRNTPIETNGWNVWSKLVRDKLETHEGDIGKLYDMSTDVKIKLAILETKAAALGAVFGLVASLVVAVLVKYF